MRLIAVSIAEIIDEDAQIIASLLDSAVDIVHLRKPCAGADSLRAILCKLSSEHRSRIVVHDYPELYAEFSLLGVHVNRNIPSLGDDYTGLRTRSCHSLDEIVRYKQEYDYLFLSPIFDSISKVGYTSQFSHDELLRASSMGIIDSRVVALGGVTPDKIAYLEQLGFGGAAMSGAIYSTAAVNSINALLHR
jgi:thiamine-phosphate pyrophosphorylase